ncbi:MAG: MAPEG family protein [Burkholderiales bacterium]
MLDRTSILFPVVALATLTFAVLLLIPLQRFRAGLAGQVAYDDFKYGESARVPPEVALPNRNMMNLLELPVLFYVACLTYYVTDRVNDTALALTWAYVGLRTAHSAIHLTYNRVRHRLLAFGASNVALVMLWTNLLRNLSA